MKIRASMSGDTADIKVLMNHPMETGDRKDAKTGQLVPAEFINDVQVTVGGKTVLDAAWGAGVSKNPFLGFKVKGAKAGDKVTVTWKDNKGATETGEATIG
jgi:sulfur-oxidizing protein SoxZ